MKKIIFILIALTLVFNTASADSNFNYIFDSKTAITESSDGRQTAFLVKVKSGVSDNFKYIIFSIQGYNGKFIAVKKHTDKKPKMFFGSLSSSITREIPFFKTNNSLLPSTLVSIIGVDNSCIEITSKGDISGKFTFYSGDE